MTDRFTAVLLDANEIELDQIQVPYNTQLIRWNNKFYRRTEGGENSGVFFAEVRWYEFVDLT